jgi:hypothetical protein
MTDIAPSFGSTPPKKAAIGLPIYGVAKPIDVAEVLNPFELAKRAILNSQPFPPSV